MSSDQDIASRDRTPDAPSINPLTPNLGGSIERIGGHPQTLGRRFPPAPPHGLSSPSMGEGLRRGCDASKRSQRASPLCTPHDHIRIIIGRVERSETRHPVLVIPAEPVLVNTGSGNPVRRVGCAHQCLSTLALSPCSRVNPLDRSLLLRRPPEADWGKSREDWGTPLILRRVYDQTPGPPQADTSFILHPS